MSKNGKKPSDLEWLRWPVCGSKNILYSEVREAHRCRYCGILFRVIWAEKKCVQIEEMKGLRDA